MRIINIDLSQDTRCPQKVFGGNAREHNESKLVVKLPERMLRDDISYYYFEFQTVLGEHIVSPNIYKNELSDGNKISVALWEQLLPFAGDLNFCVNAVNLAEDNTITIKGKTSICALQILKSPTGDDALIDVSSTKEDLQKAIDDGINEVIKKGIIVGQKTPNGGEIFSTYEGENANKALSTASSAFGQNNIAGCLGFKVSGFNKGSDVTSPITRAYVTLNTDDEHFANISVGDICSVRIKHNRNGLVVASVDNKTKTVTFTSSLGSFPDFNPSGEDYFWLVEKPEAGDTPIGIGAFAGGYTGNQAHQDGAFAIGRRNIADGRWSVALGSDNKVGYGCVAMGKGNDVLCGENSAVFGTGNKINVYGNSNLISGGRNTISNSGSNIIAGQSNELGGTGSSGSNIIAGANNKLGVVDSSIIAGQYNTVPTNLTRGLLVVGSHLKQTANVSDRVIFGTYNAPTNDARLIVGVGNSDTDRKNAFIVLDNGTARVLKQGTEPSSIVQKQYVDNSIATQVSSVYKAKGSIADISALPTPDKAHEGFVYNIENGFTTTDLFVEGAGKTYSAGTNIVIVNTTGTEYKYDVLAGMVDLSNYATKKYVDDAIGNITALFASLVDMSIPVPTNDEPTDDTEIVNEPTDNEEETVNA